MKKKTVNKLIGLIFILSITLFAVIFYFNLQAQAVKVASVVSGDTTPTLSFFIKGDFKTPLEKPMDVTKQREFIYITDAINKQVQVFDTAGTPIFKFGKEGTGKGRFMFPYGISGDSKGNIYVADLTNGNISIYSHKGEFLKYFEVKDKKKDTLVAPGALRIFNNKLYVTDIGKEIGKSKVLVFDLEGNKQLEITRGINEDDELSAPNAITIDKEENIFVSDTANQRILVYDKKGKYLRTINGSDKGKGDSTLVNPRGLGVTPSGTLLLVDTSTHFVYGYDKKGKQIYQFGGMGSENNQLYLPNGLFVDEKGKIFITDTFNQRVAVYY